MVSSERKAAPKIDIKMYIHLADVVHLVATILWEMLLTTISRGHGKYSANCFSNHNMLFRHENILSL